MKPALLVIDVQNEYFAPHGKRVLPEGEKALDQIQALLNEARKAGLPIIHITHESLPPESPVFRAGTPGSEPHAAISVLPGERHILKHFPGSFSQTPLEAYLRQVGADTVIVCGFMTHLCCDTTTRQARERGFNVLFASDATATRDLTVNGQTVPYSTIQQATLAVMTAFSTVLSTTEITSRIEATFLAREAVR